MFAAISRSSADGTAGQTQSLSRLQRSHGQADLVFSRRDGCTYASRIYQQGAMKIRFPGPARQNMTEAVLLNTAGGLTDGDRLELDVKLEENTSAMLTTQACEKVYRSLGGDARVISRIDVQPGATLHWLPQPAIFFNGARLMRETHVELAETATLLALEGVIFGRTAMGERAESGALSDSWMIRRGGRLVHADRFDAKDPIGDLLKRPLVLNGQGAMATLRYAAPHAAARLEEMRGLLANAACAAAASMVNGIMVARFVAKDGFCLTAELVRVLQAFRSQALPRVWLM